MTKVKKDADGEETVAGYFRKVFAESPGLLKGKSNDALLQRWLADHPGETEAPKSVKSGLANIKSVLRKKGRREDRRTARREAARGPGHEARGLVPGRGNQLERLEENIDDCLTLARLLDRDGLSRVIALLRAARNEVVWKMGQ